VVWCRKSELLSLSAKLGNDDLSQAIGTARRGMSGVEQKRCVTCVDVPIQPTGFVVLVGSSVVRRVLMPNPTARCCLGLWRSGRLFAPGARRCGSKLVGEESELPCVGCVEAGQRWHTAVFCLVCRCLGVGVVEFLWPCTTRLGRRSYLSLMLSSATMTLDNDDSG
jgi:hypothetical protein